MPPDCLTHCEVEIKAVVIIVLMVEIYCEIRGEMNESDHSLDS